jgi:hypothetical protein
MNSIHSPSTQSQKYIGSKAPKQQSALAPTASASCPAVAPEAGRLTKVNPISWSCRRPQSMWPSDAYPRRGAPPPAPESEGNLDGHLVPFGPRGRAERTPADSAGHAEVPERYP